MSGAAEGRQTGRRIALLLEYDGTAYCGSQYQENGPSIQAELEAAINNLTSETVRAAFAGRTDAGVHALGQVASFETSGALTVAELRSGLNHFLPADIVVKEAQQAPEWFDPRRSATGRRYRYRIANQAARPSLDRSRVWHIAKRIDVTAMVRAAESLIGEHDFAAFAGEFEGSTVRTLRRCEVSCEKDGAITVELEARAFLPHQVRRTVGPLVEIGLGRMAEADLVALLNAARPSSAGPAAPAHALYLVAITYEGFAFDTA